MAHLTFNLTPRKFYEAQRAWAEAGKTQAEISVLTTELLNKSAAEKALAQSSGTQQLGKFPKWLREFLNEQVAKLQPGAKLKWDSENDAFGVRLPQDGFELYEWMEAGSDFEKALIKRLDTEEGKIFNAEYALRPVVSDTDGQPEMRDLEAHFRAAPTEEMVHRGEGK